MKQAFSTIVILLVAVIATANSKAINFSVGYADLFCGAALPVSLPAKPFVRPPNAGPGPSVSISGFAFNPQNLVINVGESVTWTNSDGSGHTTTSDTGVWSSPVLGMGQSFSFTFTGPGTFPYHCGPHPSMTGSITVVGPSPTPTETSTSTPTPSNTPTNTVTNTPTSGPTPILGTYSNGSALLSGNSTFTPSAAPLNTNSMTASTNTNFKGTLFANPVTGVVHVTDAHPAGVYPITVKAFDPSVMASTTFMLTVTTPVTCNPYSFGPATTFAGGHSPSRSVAVGDFNGDSNQDIVSGGSNGNDISIRLGDGAGKFSAATNITLGYGPGPIAVSDFNGDGKQDIAIGHSSLSVNSLAILFGDGSGNFGTPTTFSLPALTLVVGDFNGDGKSDIATGIYNAPGRILLGDGLGGFGTPITFAASALALAVGDFNNDSSQDIVVTSYTGPGPAIFLGNGTGGFSPAGSYLTGFTPRAVAVGDFNGDSNQDIGVASDNSVYIFSGNGTGGFTQSGIYTLGASVLAVAVGDVNGDANQDLVVTTGGLAILFGNGAGSFNFIAAPFGPVSAVSTAIGDFNGDGKQDIGTAKYDGLAVLLRDCSWISGTVTYGNPASPGTKFISNVTVTGTGSPNASATTGPLGSFAGAYTLFGFGSGSYAVSLSTTRGVNGISAGDASRIAQHAAGILTIPSARQRIAADTTGNGSITAADAVQTARLNAGLPVAAPMGNWKFFVPDPGFPTFPIGSSPTTRSYSDPISNPTGQDYIGILVGEVTGNWNNTGARPVDGERSAVSSEQEAIDVKLPQMTVSTEKDTIVPVIVQGVADKGITAYEFNLRYDPSVVQPMAEAVDVAGTVSRGLMVVTNAIEPGLLRLAVYGVMPIEKDGVLLNLRFASVGAVGSVSALTFERIVFNEGEALVIVSDGRVELL